MNKTVFSNLSPYPEHHISFEWRLIDNFCIPVFLLLFFLHIHKFLPHCLICNTAFGFKNVIIPQ